MNIIFFGDSICVGQFVSPHKTWVVKTGEKVSTLFKDQDISVMNPSVNGNTTRMALERMPFDVQSHGIDIILIQFGMNDCNYWLTDNGVPRVSKAGFEANLKEMVARSKIFGAKKIFINTNHPSTIDRKFDHVDLCYQDSNSSYNEIIRKVSSDTGVELIDIEKVFMDKINSGVELKSLLLPDEIHLSPQGHDLYMSVVCDRIISAVEEII